MMRIHYLQIDNVRGIDHLELKDLPETGVVVIHGDNEVGKSTLAEAIDVVLTEKHGGRSRKIQALQPVGKDVGPQITLEATVGPWHLRISKRWLRKKSSELQILGPHPAQFTGGQADDELDRILAAHLDRQLLQTLFLRQDDLGEGISAVGIPSLTAALEQASGVAAGAITAEDSEIMTKVEDEYRKYFSARKAQPAHDYKAAIAALEQAEARDHEAREKLRALDGIVEEYERILEKQEAAESSLPQAKKESDEAAAALDNARQAAEKAAAQQERVNLAEVEVKRLKLLVTERAELRSRVKEAETNLEMTSKELAAARTKDTAEAQTRQVLEEQLERSQAQWLAARGRLKLARRLQARQECAELQRRMASLDGLEQSLSLARDAFKQAPEVKDEDLAQLRAAVQDVTVCTRVHEATAAKLRLSAVSPTEITVDTEAVTIGEEIAVELVDGTRLQIGTVSAVYQAAAGVGEDTKAAVERARLRLRDAQEVLGCETPEEAEKLREQHRKLWERLDRAEREWQLALGEDDISDLRMRQELLLEQVADLPEESIDLSEAETQEEAARRAVEADEKSLAPYREGALKQEVVKWETRWETADGEMHQARQKLQSAREVLGDEDLQDSVSAAEQVFEERAAKLAAMQEADLDTAQALLEGAQSRVSSLEEEVRQAELDLREHTSYIEMHSGAAEDAELAAAELEAARDTHESVARRARAARYLRDLLIRYRDAARERYAQPFTEQLSEFARMVFGKGVSFELNEELRIQARTRDNQTVPVESLSGGAKEQLAILTRFAIAKMVDDEGVPVIVDDALGSTDLHRLQLMSTLFSAVGKYAQVLVLTCVPGRYSRVVGRTEYRFTDLQD